MGQQWLGGNAQGPEMGHWDIKTLLQGKLHFGSQIARLLYQCPVSDFDW